MKDNRLTNSLCFFSSAIGIASLLCCVGYFHGYPQALAEEKMMSLEYGVGEFSQKSYIELPNSPLNLVQQKRPRFEEARERFSENVFIGNDYSYFFPNVLGFTMNEEKQMPCMFLPVYSFVNPLVEIVPMAMGELPLQDNLAYCVVNDCFLKEYQSEVGQTIRVEYQSKFDQGRVTDVIDLDLSFTIAGVVNEFSFLNTPKVYYSYLGLEDYFEGLALMEASMAEENEVSLSSRLFFLPGDSCYGRYHWSLFAKNGVGAIEIEEASQRNDGEFEVSSNAITVVTTFQNLSDALASCLVIFVAISFLCLALMIAMSSFSSFLSKKKESAILLSMGAKQKDIIALFSEEKSFVTLAASIFGILVSPLLAKGFNLALSSKFAMSEIIRLPLSFEYPIPFLLPLFALLLGPLIAFVATWIPLKRIGCIDVSEVLKDE